MIALTLLSRVPEGISGEELIHKNSVLEGFLGEDASIRSYSSTSIIERKERIQAISYVADQHTRFHICLHSLVARYPNWSEHRLKRKFEVT